MSSNPTPALPAPRPEQAFCDVSVLEGGFMMTFLAAIAVAGASPDDKYASPSLAFLLKHNRTGEHLIFDLGVPRLDPGVNAVASTPAILKASVPFTFRVPQDVPASLQKGGLAPEDVSRVLLSHVHFDHVGEPVRFPRAQFLVGAGGRPLLAAGYPKDPNSYYAQELLATPEREGRVEWLDPSDDAGKWEPLGLFHRALDYWGDGSLYIVDAPGHVAGHLNVLARTSADGGWIYLAGDAAHDWRLLQGEGKIAVIHHPLHGRICMHGDEVVAADTIGRIRELLTLPRVRVMLAHDREWYEENKDGDAFWPGKLQSL